MKNNTDTKTLRMPTAYALLIGRSLTAARTDASNILSCDERTAQQRISTAYDRLIESKITGGECRFKATDPELLTMLNALSEAIYIGTDEIPTDTIRSIHFQMLREYHAGTPSAIIA